MNVNILGGVKVDFLRHETLADNVWSPLLDTVNRFFPIVLLGVTVICALYAGIIGLKYYLARNDDQKRGEMIALAKRGGITIAVIYAVFILLKILISVGLRSLI